MKTSRRQVIVALISMIGLWLIVEGTRAGAGQVVSSAPVSAPQAPFQRVQTFTLEATPGNIMSDTYPVYVEEVFYNWPAPPIGVLRLPSDAWDRSGSTPSGPLTALDYSTVVTPGAQSWVKVSYRTRQRATRSGLIVTLSAPASLYPSFVQQLTSTVVFTRQYPAPPPSEPHKFDDYWGFTTPRMLSIDPAPAQPAQPGQQNWARWFTTTDWFHGDVVFQEPLLGSDLTVTQLIMDPPYLELGHSNRYTVTIRNIGTMTASRWFYNELYIKPGADPPPSGAYDHVWGLITYQGDALLRHPSSNDYQIGYLAPSSDITLFTVITVTSMMPGGTSYRVYAQADTAYFGDLYHFAWFGTNAEGYGTAPYTEEQNVAAYGPLVFNPAVYGVRMPQSVTHTVLSSSSVVYLVPVSNTGNVDDIYTVTLTGGKWATSAPQALGPIANSQSTNLAVTVTVPCTANGQDSDIVTVTLTSKGDPAQTASVAVHTIAGWYGVTGCSISGRVVTNGGNNSISGVTVSASSDGSATTDASGYYTITGLITGTYTLTPTKSGYTFLPVTRTVTVPPNATGQDFTGTSSFAWTLMFYLDGDNNLDSGYILPVFNQLEAAASNPNVQVLALWDRPGTGGASYYKIQYDTDLNRLATYTSTVNYWPQGEVNMGISGTLASFVNWARTNYPAQHYALILSDHGNGLGGAMWDDTSSGDHLTVSEIGMALASVTANGTNKIDVLYMDACLMGMIEDAYQVRNYTDYYVASESIKFGLSVPHFQSVSSIAATTSPSQLATLFTTTYDDGCYAESLPCTMSASDISRLNNVVTATNSLAGLLNSQMATSAITLTTIQSAVQRFEMNGDDVINLTDDYIDLYDFAKLVKADFSDASLQTSAQNVMDTITAYILTERHRSGVTGGTTWNLDNSHGVSIFFPSRASSFYRADNYDFAAGALWPGALGSRMKTAQAMIEWGPMLVNYFQTTQPGGPDNPNPPLPLPQLLEYRVYLPVVIRQ